MSTEWFVARGPARERRIPAALSYWSSTAGGKAVLMYGTYHPRRLLVSESGEQLTVAELLATVGQGRETKA